MRLRLASLLWCLMLLPGCVVIQVTARNPIPEMSTIAVVPFFNLTQEPNSVVDGRRFALAYYSELQKTQGFEVIPVGVVESTILQHRLELQNPRDALKLCEILKADAVVVGAVTDYDAYYPPRIGMQVDWYSPYEWTAPVTSAGLLDGSVQMRGMNRMNRRRCKPVRIRGQSPDAKAHELNSMPPPSSAADLLDPPEYHGLTPEASAGEVPPSGQLPTEPAMPGSGPAPHEGPNGPIPNLSEGEHGEPEFFPGEKLPPVEDLPSEETGPAPEKPIDHGRGMEMSQPSSESTPMGLPEGTLPGGTELDVEFDPTQPLMSYTRMFDGAESELVNKLRDYLELRGDRRLGSWEEYLHRSEDFIRFVSHVMIVEMLSVHGGANRTQIVLKWRKYR